MNSPSSPAPSGRVASLHLHPLESGEPMSSVETIELVEHKGLSGEPRYFGKLSRRTGQASRRQVSLMEREQIAVVTHAVAPELAAQVAEQIAARTRGRPPLITELGPTVGTYLGPGTVGIGYCPAP